MAEAEEELVVGRLVLGEVGDDDQVQASVRRSSRWAGPTTTSRVGWSRPSSVASSRGSPCQGRMRDVGGQHLVQDGGHPSTHCRSTTPIFSGAPGTSVDPDRWIERDRAGGVGRRRRRGRGRMRPCCRGRRRRSHPPAARRSATKERQRHEAAERACGWLPCSFMLGEPDDSPARRSVRDIPARPLAHGPMEQDNPSAGRATEEQERAMDLTEQEELCAADAVGLQRPAGAVHQLHAEAVAGAVAHPGPGRPLDGDHAPPGRDGRRASGPSTTTSPPACGPT